MGRTPDHDRRSAREGAPRRAMRVCFAVQPGAGILCREDHPEEVVTHGRRERAGLCDSGTPGPGKAAPSRRFRVEGLSGLDRPVREGRLSHAHPNLSNLGKSFEIRGADIVHVEDVPETFAPFAASMIWVKPDADVASRTVEVATRKASAKDTDLVEVRRGRIRMLRQGRSKARSVAQALPGRTARRTARTARPSARSGSAAAPATDRAGRHDARMTMTRSLEEAVDARSTAFDALAHEAPYLIEKLVKNRVVDSAEEGRALFLEVKRYLVLNQIDRTRIWKSTRSGSTRRGTSSSSTPPSTSRSASATSAATSTTARATRRTPVSPAALRRRPSPSSPTAIARSSKSIFRPTGSIPAACDRIVAS